MQPLRLGLNSDANFVHQARSDKMTVLTCITIVTKQYLSMPTGNQGWYIVADPDRLLCEIMGSISVSEQ